MVTRRAFVAGGMAALIPFSSARGVVAVSGLGRLITIPVASAVVAPRTVAVWLPDGYDENPWAYPVLYIPYGDDLFAKSRAGSVSEPGIDDQIAGLAFAGAIRAPIIVAIGRSRDYAREYAPAAPIAMLGPAGRADVERQLGGHSLSEPYLHFITAELKPLIDRRFRTLRAASDTAILGTGLAGITSLYAMLRDPGVFGNAACLSDGMPLAPLLGRDDAAAAIAASHYLGRALPRAGQHRLYVDFGSITGHRTGLRLHDAFVSTARAKGYAEGLDLITAVQTAETDNPWRRIDQTETALTLMLSGRCRAPQEGRSD